jgi:hypothetical protein
MSIFSVEEPYFIDRKPIKLIDFHDKKHLYVKRPPYQRKSVWSRKKQMQLIDSFFRQYYVPRIVLRRVDFAEGRHKYEVVDGQQRIDSIQRFFADQIPLPKSLRGLTPEAGKLYSELPESIKNYVEDLDIGVDVIRKVEDPEDTENQRLVTKVFWRLQQGESLTYMEQEHSKLYSAVRNFVTKYADEIAFDWKSYEHRSTNPDRHPFFEIIDQPNDRMQHLALLVRFLMIELEGRVTDLNYKRFPDLFDRFDGVPLEEFEEKSWVKKCRNHLDKFFRIFKEDTVIKGGGKLKELRQEYFIISTYLLLRHLVEGNFTFGQENYEDFRKFVYSFYQRWKEQDEEDKDIFIFRDSRQQDTDSIIKRDQIIKHAFFESNPHIEHTDPQRLFTEAQRIAIYRRDGGLCQACLEEGLSEEEARVPWTEFEADHIIPHHKGGETSLENGQLLCRRHNRKFGAK